RRVIGIQGILGDMLAGEGPAVDVQGRSPVALGGAALPAPVVAEQVEALRCQRLGELRQDVMIVVTGHGEGVNARSEQAPQAALQWADGLEEAVGLIYQVAAEGDDIDALSQRRLDDGIPGGGTAVRRAVERIRQLAGAPSDVQVSGAQ